MRLDKDICKHYIVWHKDVFRFMANATTALYNV
jgi:hypothetical protein